MAFLVKPHSEALDRGGLLPRSQCIWNVLSTDIVIRCPIRCLEKSPILDSSGDQLIILANCQSGTYVQNKI